MRLHRLPAAWLALTAGWVSAAPAPGRYDGELCVALSAAAPNCGKAELRWARSGALSVRVHDIVYRVQLRRGPGGDRAEVVLMQGTVQLDEFVSPYAWAGQRLRFADSDRQASYEVRFPASRP